MSFIFYNPNPSGKRTGDCVIRAIAKATGQDWERAYTNLCVEGYTLYDLPSSNRVWGSYLQSKNVKRGTKKKKSNRQIKFEKWLKNF